MARSPISLTSPSLLKDLHLRLKHAAIDLDTDVSKLLWHLAEQLVASRQDLQPPENGGVLGD